MNKHFQLLIQLTLTILIFNSCSDENIRPNKPLFFVGYKGSVGNEVKTGELVENYVATFTPTVANIGRGNSDEAILTFTVEGGNGASHSGDENWELMESLKSKVLKTIVIPSLSENEKRELPQQIFDVRNYLEGFSDFAFIEFKWTISGGGNTNELYTSESIVIMRPTPANYQVNVSIAESMYTQYCTTLLKEEDKITLAYRFENDDELNFLNSENIGSEHFFELWFEETDRTVFLYNTSKNEFYSLEGFIAKGFSTLETWQMIDNPFTDNVINIIIDEGVIKVRGESYEFNCPEE